MPAPVIMKPGLRVFLLIGGVVAIVGGGAFWAFRATAPVPLPVVSGPAAGTARPSFSPSAVAVPEAATRTDPSPEPTPDGHEQALQRIEAAVVTYEAASLPVIAPYLTHADPGLRLAAREGLLQMGLSEAAPLLREAAGKMKDPREAILLLDAADFLELPSIPATATLKRGPRPASSPRVVETPSLRTHP